MSPAGPRVAFPLALAVVAGPWAACAPPDRGAPAAGHAAAGQVAAPARQSPAPVSVPDLSGVAPSIRDQIQAAHDRVTATLQREGASAEDVAGAYGDLGKTLLAAEFGKAAEACFRNAELLAPDDLRWPYYLGHVYKATGDTSGSATSFERALQLNPKDGPTRIWLGEAYLTLDRIDAARAMFSEGLSIGSVEGPALVGLGRVALATRQYAEAAGHLERALAMNQRGDDLHYALALAYRGLGQAARAEVHLGQRGQGQTAVADPLMDAVRALQRSSNTFESRGVQALEHGDLEAAASQFRQGLALAPNDASLHHRLGTVLLLAGDTKAGRAEIETALRLAPNLARAHYSLAVLSVSGGQFEQAVSRLSEAVRHEPGYVEARLLLGDVLRRTGRARESLRQYQEVMQLDPRVVQAQLGHAVALAALNDYRGARDRLTAAMATHPGDPELAQALSRVLAASPDDRVRDGARAVALMQPLAPSQANAAPDVCEAMAMALAETGRYEEAATWQRQAIAAAERVDRASPMRLEMAQNLTLFERGRPSRTPWADYALP